MGSARVGAVNECEVGNEDVNECEAGNEDMNECEAGNSPPDTGGVAAPSRKSCEATAAAQTGWLGLPKSSGVHSSEEVPFPTTSFAPSKEASRLFLDVASTPPISGGAPNSFTPESTAPTELLHELCDTLLNGRGIFSYFAPRFVSCGIVRINAQSPPDGNLRTGH